MKPKRWFCSSSWLPKAGTFCDYAQAKGRLQHSHQPLSIYHSMLPHLLPSPETSSTKRHAWPMKCITSFFSFISFLRNLSSTMVIPLGYVFLADSKSGICTSTAVVRLLRFWKARNVNHGCELMGSTCSSWTWR